MSRGFTKNILIKYDVGECLQYGKEMSYRAVVPIYDINNEYAFLFLYELIYNKIFLYLHIYRNCDRLFIEKKGHGLSTDRKH